MMKRYLRTIFLGTLLLVLSGRDGAAADFRESFDDRGEGKQMIEELLQRQPAEGMEVLGLLKIAPADSFTIEVPVRWTVRVGEKGWQDIYQTQPVAAQDGQLLIIQHQPGAKNQYLFGYTTNASAPPKLNVIEGERIWHALAGSDFYIADLGLEFLHWPSQKIVKKEMRKGRSCRVVESLNPSETEGPYSRVLSWLDFETGNLIRAEGYDRNNRLLKEFSVKKIKRVEGRAQLKEIEIRNDRTDSRTALEFNLEVDGIEEP